MSKLPKKTKTPFISQFQQHPSFTTSKKEEEKNTLKNLHHKITTSLHDLARASGSFRILLLKSLLPPYIKLADENLQKQSKRPFPPPPPPLSAPTYAPAQARLRLEGAAHAHCPCPSVS